MSVTKQRNFLNGAFKSHKGLRKLNVQRCITSNSYNIFVLLVENVLYYFIDGPNVKLDTKQSNPTQLCTPARTHRIKLGKLMRRCTYKQLNAAQSSGVTFANGERRNDKQSCAAVTQQPIGGFLTGNLATFCCLLL